MGTIITPLSQASIHAVLLDKINDPKFEGRDEYVGGSEVGGCAREVAWKKVRPERALITDPQAAGRILAGQIMENPIVQLVRAAFDGAVRETGRAQVELAHETAPLKCHPDGRLIWKVDWVEGMQIAYLDEMGQPRFLDKPLEGHGTQEIKTCNAAIFRKYTKGGLPPRYIDQTMVEMGLSGTSWTLLVLVNRENLAQFVSFIVIFDPDRYEKCVMRSHIIMEAKQRVLEAFGAEFMDLAEAEAMHLPAGEPERGWCDYCDHRDACPAHAFKPVDADSAAVFPEDVALEIEVLAEEYLESKPTADRCKKLSESLKEKFVEHGVREAYGLMLTTGEGRTTVDGKKLETEHPDIYKSVLKKGDPVHSLKIARPKKGAPTKKG